MLDGIPVRVFDTKTPKTPLLLLHGYLETLEVWESFIPLVSDTYRVIAPDLPGHGVSGTFEVNTMERCAGVLASYLKKEHLSGAVVAGHSMGGYIAQALLNDYPDLVKGLILLHSTPFADTPLKREARDKEIALIQRGGLEKIVELSIPLMFAEENRSKFHTQIEAICGAALSHSPEGICASLLGMKTRPDYTELLAATPLPLMFFFGLKDYHISEEKARQLAASYPQATTVFLASSGHNGFKEEPQAVAEALRTYQRKLPNG